MVLPYKIHFECLSAGEPKAIWADLPQDMDEHDLFIECRTEGDVFRVVLKAKGPLSLKKAHFLFEGDFSDEAFLCQGYQTWTETRKWRLNQRQRPVAPLAKPLLGPFGDTSFATYGKGRHHAFTYTLLEKGDERLFLGSVDEKDAYTLFYRDKTGSLLLERDVEGIEMQNGDECVLLALFSGEGKEKDLYETYASLVPRTTKPGRRVTGWTSWYNYYTRITEDRILKELAAYDSSDYPIDIFQIDDGYQRAVGDWLILDDGFPSGMKALSDSIKKAGYKPGLWLAPFCAEKKSLLFQEHPDWIQKDSHGKPVKAGFNPGWSGFFYSLDLFNPEVLEYLEEVFRVVTDEWGFELLKLDFLYSAGRIPAGGFSRGGAMHRAMELVREWIRGKAEILGCGIPVSASLDTCEYSRIGADVAPKWNGDKYLSLLTYTEKVSTLSSLTSTLNRAFLNGRFFSNDPDVFYLRTQKNKMTQPQNETLTTLNYILGSLIFTSDSISAHTQEQALFYRSLYPLVNPDLDFVEEVKRDVYQIRFSLQGVEYTAFANLTGNSVSRDLNEPLFVSTEQASSRHIKLAPYSTLILNKPKGSLLGSRGHLLPLAETASIEEKGETLRITIKEGLLYNPCFYVEKSISQVFIHGKAAVLKESGSLITACLEESLISR